jgi:hypothetical protein
MGGSWRVTSNETIQRYEREGWRVLLTAPSGHQYDIFLTPPFLDAQEIFEPDDGDTVRAYFGKALAEDPVRFRRRHGLGSRGLAGELQRLRGTDEGVIELVWSPEGLCREDRDRRVYPRHRYQAPVAIRGLNPGAGVTADISRSGVRVFMAGWVSEDAEGHPCAVRFMGPGDEVKPVYAGGVVRRVRTAAGSSEISIVFDDPLRVLSVANEASP